MSVFQNLKIIVQIPEHTHVAAEVLGVQNLLRHQIVQTNAGSEQAISAAAVKAEEVFPKHTLLTKLMPGIRIYKHGIFMAC